MKVYGKNVFNEYKDKLHQVKKVYIARNLKDQTVFDILKTQKVSYDLMDSGVMDKMVSGKHQGIIMIIDDYQYADVETFYKNNVIVMLDHLEDPHNLGAIIRTCEAAGIKSIILPKDRSVSVNETVYKTSSGALANINIAVVGNLVSEIKKLKNEGFFIYGADMIGTDYKKIDYAQKVVLVIGNEGKGISKLVRENCDEMISIPMFGKVNSLNASVAAGILVYSVINR